MSWEKPSFETMQTIERDELELKKNCIYCLKPIEIRTKEHLIQKNIGGVLEFRCLCKDCNNGFGNKGDLDDQLTKDYWINYAQKYLGISSKDTVFKIDPLKQNHFSHIVREDGSLKVTEPFTDSFAFRIVAKMGFNMLAFILGNNIFDKVFDPLRSYVLNGIPDLGGRRVIRTARGSIWHPSHVVTFNPSARDISIEVAIFNAYSFLMPINGVNASEFFPIRIAMHLEDKNLHVWTCQDRKKWRYRGHT